MAANVLCMAMAAVMTLCGGWLACLVLCASVTVQRHVCYLHKLPIWRSQKLDIPESFGFLHKQVLPLHIATSDNESLYAWLVTPLALYARHQDDFLRQKERRQDASDVAIRLLQDVGSQLVIYFHGNAGSVGNTRRTEAYRTLTSGASEDLHVLAFDYRGFGRSSGSPTEQGLIIDALSVIEWARTIGKIPTDRIILVAQSLGTAAAIGAVEALLKDSPDTVFAGICLCAAFTDMAAAFTSYKIGGSVPLMYPLQLVSPLRQLFARRIQDKWMSEDRLQRIVKCSKKMRLTLIAATSDEVIPFQHTEALYHAVLEPRSEGEAMYERDHGSCATIDLQQGSTVQQCTRGGHTIRKVLVRYGGHNGIMKWSPVAFEVLLMSQIEIPLN